ncbi:hypothetical protein FRB99_006616 [Tulasnella sp. 403]|nr:hypothetical protein FRB99_006616 [Tulasnella sp. 403]
MDPTEFESLTAHLEEEAKMREQLREVINEFEKKVRIMTGILNKIHATPTSQFPKLVESVTPILQSVHQQTAALAGLIRPHEFWRVKDMFTRTFQLAVYIVTLCEWIRTGTLASISHVSRELGIQEDWADRLQVTTEEYLHGVISLINDLSRLAVNAVTMKDYELPSKISTFVKELHAGFSLLNLKNDALRRRFDSIKYDVKRIEEVVYDISLRKLGDQDPAAEADAVKALENAIS